MGVQYNRQDVLVILQSLWVHKYNRQVILQSLWVYKYNRQDVLVILQSLWVYKYNRQDVLVNGKIEQTFEISCVRLLLQTVLCITSSSIVNIPGVDASMENVI